jgi:hypothetical protein
VGIDSGSNVKAPTFSSGLDLTFALGFGLGFGFGFGGWITEASTSCFKASISCSISKSVFSSILRQKGGVGLGLAWCINHTPHTTHHPLNVSGGDEARRHGCRVGPVELDFLGAKSLEPEDATNLTGVGDSIELGKVS